MTARGEERYLVTGAYGCIGSWVVAELLEEEVPVVAFDVGASDHRLRLLLDDAQLAGVERVQGDITDLVALERALDEHGITDVIHLAALQVPFCRADPPLGARVNVVGTVNIFEAAKRRRGRIGHVVYASSVAAYDALEEGVAPAMSAHPSTLYGVYKRANEGTAWVYWNDDRIASVGLRPHTVYGLGRDQGLTSAPTKAMLAAAAGLPYRIPYGGASQLQYAADVARTVILASRVDAEGATVHNLAGPSVHMADVVASIQAAAPESTAEIAFDDVLLPFPEAVESQSLEAAIGPLALTPIQEGVRLTVERFRGLLAAGRISPAVVER